MPVPKKHHTKTRTGKRRSHHALGKVKLFVCAKCGKPALPHRVCPACGFYKGKEIVDTLARLDKKERKAREKEQALRDKEQAKKEKKQANATSLEELSKKS